MSKKKKAVCAGGIVLNREGLVLVVNSSSNSWSLPKGHLEKGESTLEAAVREIMEESGVTRLDLQEYIGSYKRYKIGADGRKDRSRRKEIHLYLFRTEQQGLYPLDHHTQDARWVPKEQVPELLTYKKDRKYFQQVMCKW